MKGCATFVVIIACALGIAYGLSVLDRRDEEQNAQFVGAVRFVEQAVSASFAGAGTVRFFAPVMEEPQPGSDLRRVRGIVALPAPTPEPRHRPYKATLASICDDYAASDCWRLENLIIGDYPLAVVASATRAAADALRAEARPPDSSITEPVNAADPSPAGPAVTLAPAIDTAPPATNSPRPAPPSPDAEARQVADVPAGKLVLRIQQALKGAGFDPGPIDGKMGPATRAAIQAYQRSLDLRADGKPTRELLQRLAATR